MFLAKGMWLLSFVPRVIGIYLNICTHLHYSWVYLWLTFVSRYTEAWGVHGNKYNKSPAMRGTEVHHNVRGQNKARAQEQRWEVCTLRRPFTCGATPDSTPDSPSLYSSPPTLSILSDMVSVLGIGTELVTFHDLAEWTGKSVSQISEKIHKNYNMCTIHTWPLNTVREGKWNFKGTLEELETVFTVSSKEWMGSVTERTFKQRCSLLDS